ncbi:MAG: hypothetical protein HYV59_07325 [Planctomycetes bacterium]|nr:hypothetical protein [Planctomycetota bacterium]
MKTASKVFVIPVVLLLLMLLSNILKAEQMNACKPLPKPSNPQSAFSNPQLKKTEVIQKTQKLQMPFIANEGQTDERMKPYANTDFDCQC